ncbi:Protein of unknown function [Polaromonas sp. YR568]|uniref:DUF3034 family protein n=1 Tax=Polaromonas sp. YR568 TaxID=1855301 RepID=UPI0008F3A1FE|nr:DUF3034 family protein [Polaromonas sp. YR568]SFU85169.1 Protein of unknown function [Polaromonas sp. YR568]
MHKLLPYPLALMASLFLAAGAQADTGKLLLTGGVSTIEGSAGGGLTPWAVIGSNATADEIGGSAYVTHVGTNDYGLNIYGAAVGIHDRYELSIAQQDFNTRGTGVALGLPGLHLKQTIVGAKVRVLGDAILDSDTLMPQVAVGVQYKTLGSTGLNPTLDALGAKRHGVDVYVSATKLFLSQSLLLNGTLRATKANQNGLLGYGATLGGNEDKYTLQPEFSIAYLLSKNIAIGAEYRFMRNKLEGAGRAAGLGNGLRSEDWKDIFIAWAPSKNFSLTLAYVDLGVIVPATTVNRKQTGYYVSAQVAF